MLELASDTSPNYVPATLAIYFGLFLFLLSFLLPAVGTLTGLDCAWLAMNSWKHDDKISSLALFGGWLNPQVLLLFFLSALRAARRLRAVLTVTILFSIPMTWLAVHRMRDAGMAMDLKIGHYLWVTGILLIAAPNLPSVFDWRFTRWLTAAAATIIALMSIPLLIGLTMHTASEM